MSAIWRLSPKLVRLVWVVSADAKTARTLQLFLLSIADALSIIIPELQALQPLLISILVLSFKRCFAPTNFVGESFEGDFHSSVSHVLTCYRSRVPSPILSEVMFSVWHGIAA